MIGFGPPMYKPLRERADEVVESIKHAFHEDLLVAQRNGVPLKDDKAFIEEVKNADWYPAALLAYSFEYIRRKRQDDALRTMRSVMRELRLID